MGFIYKKYKYENICCQQCRNRSRGNWSFSSPRKLFAKHTNEFSENGGSGSSFECDIHSTKTEREGI